VFTNTQNIYGSRAVCGRTSARLQAVTNRRKVYIMDYTLAGDFYLPNLELYDPPDAMPLGR
jgi:hypothetical protein